MRFKLLQCLNNFHKPFVLTLGRNLWLKSCLKQECAARQNDQSDGECNTPDHVDLAICPAWLDGNEETKAIRSALITDMRVIPNFISEEEEKTVYSELEPILKKMRYEFDHWDDAIHGFRETERTTWKESQGVIDRIKSTGIIPPEIPLPHIHVLDLDAKGYIKPHVDAVRFCGHTVAGVCMLSPAVMRLRHTKRTELFADFLLSRRSFYIMTKSSRYDYTHEILKNELSVFKNDQVTRTRRISVITRSQRCK